MTSTSDGPYTIAERYSSATESSNLRIGERRGDVDYIIAAGLIPNGLGAAMYRLQVEYDCVRADHAAAENRMRSLERMAAGERGEDDEKGTTAEERAAEIMQTAEQEATTAHLLILSQLTSLREAKALLGDFAIVQATKRRFMRPDREALIIAGQVLDAWLNPNCKHCQGRGFNGSTLRGEKPTPCRPCKGSGHRRDLIGKDDAQRQFAGHLTAELDALMHQVQRDIRTGLRRVEQAKQQIADA